MFQKRARKASKKLAFYKEIERQEQAVNDLGALVVLGDQFFNQPSTFQARIYLKSGRNDVLKRFLG